MDQLFSQDSLSPLTIHISTLVDHRNLALEKHSYTTFVFGILTTLLQHGILILLEKNKLMIMLDLVLYSQLVVQQSLQRLITTKTQ